MEIGTPFIIECPEEEFENHIDTGTKNTDTVNLTDEELPFRFSRTRMWSENFYSPEIGNGHSIAALGKEMEDVKQLLGEIRDILKGIFELDS